MRVRSLISSALLVALTINLPALGATNTAEFGQCLKDSGMTLYSAYWCPYCLAQLKEFDPSFTASDMKNERKVAEQFPFVTECTSHAAPAKKLDNPECKGLRGIPAWKLPNGNIRYGVHSLEDLAEFSGCKDPSPTR